MCLRLAASVDQTLEEDDMSFSEQLKEYLHFSEVLKYVLIAVNSTYVPRRTKCANFVFSLGKLK